jgi:hypothetical protein
LPPESQLRALQVKAELAKLGDAPRAYLEKIKPQADESMDDAAANAALALMGINLSNSRLSLTERFEKIQGARPGGPPGSEGGSGGASAG